MNRQYSLLAIAMFLSLSTAGVTALETRPVLTLAMAKTMADACEARAAAEGWRKVNIAIFDAGANLKLFRRQDDAYVHSIRISQMKGRTSAGFPRSTRALGDLNYKTPGRPVGIENVGGLAMFPGGLPILTADGVQIGGIGISGATGDQDELCAQAGIDAIAGQLK